MKRKKLNFKKDIIEDITSLAEVLEDFVECDCYNPSINKSSSHIYTLCEKDNDIRVCKNKGVAMCTAMPFGSVENDSDIYVDICEKCFDAIDKNKKDLKDKCSDNDRIKNFLSLDVNDWR